MRIRSLSRQILSPLVPRLERGYDYWLRIATLHHGPAYGRICRQIDVEGAFIMVSGPADIELLRLRQKLGYADINPEVDKDTSRHSGMIRIGNEPQSLWSACQGSARPEWIAEEISFLVPRQLGVLTK